MKILLLGSGAREHALARALAADPATESLVLAPGNPGCADLGERVDIDILDGAAVVRLAMDKAVDLVVVGPEAPLVAGVADPVRAAGIPVFGPSGAAARLEGSKAYAKEIMALAEVPTAMAHVCVTREEVEAALDAFGPPYVVKDDGLAAGKGVVVTEDRDAALNHAVACLAPAVGGDESTGGRAAVVVEEFLDGPEVSLFCLSDGERVLPLAPAQDFKRIGDGDTGPNTGGMGAYSPLPWAPADLTEQVVERVAQPVIDELARRGTPFVGLLYCGLALTSRGLRVIEFNVRFGDPEVQVVLPRLRTPLAGLLHAAATGSLPAGGVLEWDEGAVVGVVVASSGYPGKVRTGDRVEGLTECEAIDGVHVVQAGTAEAGVASGSRSGGGSGSGSGTGADDDAASRAVVSDGGRVLTVVGRGADLAAARDAAYAGVAEVRLEGSQHRTDIALAAVEGRISVPELG
ncbi:phosphoribosylamine--glycine ligase [Georgenia sp. Z1344]|uniref:phosphoribosylamine--glycine ligase n=1 Tax=Georgenia sp. Z1344 TaxID=3416706 RepID=UPI003CF95C6D